MNEKNFNKKIYINIQKTLEEKEISQKTLSLYIGTSEQNLSKKLKKLKNGDGITTTSLFQICKALRIDPKVLF